MQVQTPTTTYHHLNFTRRIAEVLFNMRFDHKHTHAGQTSHLLVNFVQSGNYFFLLFVHQEDNLYI